MIAELEHRTITLDEIDEFLRSRRIRHCSFNVAPRYTCGSPAAVDLKTFHRFANEELEFHAIAKTGVWGVPKQREAEEDDLACIAYIQWEAKNRVWRHDFLTGVTLNRRYKHAWEGMPKAPSFERCEEAVRFARRRGYAYVYGSLEGHELRYTPTNDKAGQVLYWENPAL